MQPQTLIQGNLDPIVLRIGGEGMERSLSRILTALRGGRYIFNLGHGILPQTPPEHVEQLVSFVRNYPE
jgi:uroporphyrinogen decarboxylase